MLFTSLDGLLSDWVSCVVQVMCSYLADSSALPVLLGHWDVIALATDMVHASTKTGKFPLMPVVSLHHTSKDDDLSCPQPLGQCSDYFPNVSCPANCAMPALGDLH
jgi:hypothetical protein